MAEGARLAPALGLMAASGFSALGLQIVWTQQTAAWLGHEAAAVLGVVTAFFGGLALGALAFGPAVQRSRRPLVWYAACEAVIAGWAVLLLLLMTPAASGLLAATGVQPAPAWQWGLSFGGTLLLLLPATAAMGATLPAMERLLADSGLQRASVAALYGANTLGAVLGVLAAAFWLVPGWGLTATAGACATLNALCAAVAWHAFSRKAPAAPALPAAAVAAEPARRIAALLAATGCLGIGYEVLVVRVLSQLGENTVYSFALLLAVYLAGTAAGAALLHRALRRRPPTRALRDGLLLALCAACLAGGAVLWALAALRQPGAAITGMAAALATEAAWAALAFGPATLVMGALFSTLAHQAVAAGLGLGRAIGINTLGAALAPPLLGVLLVPALGSKAALLVLAAAYLLLLSGSAWRRPATVALAGTGAALALWAPPLQVVDVPAGGRLLSYAEGTLAAVSVVEDEGGERRLHINNRQQEGSSATALADGRQALLPLLLHAAPQRALFLGLGTGTTAAAAAQDTNLQVDAVELLPEVVQAAALFTPAVAEPARHPRLRVQVADARRFVRAGGAAYDVVVSDNFHPARGGSAALYTVEHFTAVKARLAAGGLFCQWLPLHQMDLATLQSVVRAYTAVYPNAVAMLATNSLQTPVVGLVARGDGKPLALADVRGRLAGAALQQPAALSGLNDEWAVLGSIVAGPQALAGWSAGAPLNTDDHPVVAYMAPRITYAPDSLPGERLLQWLATVTAQRQAGVDSGGDAAAAARLGAYWQARDAFLLAGRQVRAVADPQQMLQQVQQPLLEVLRTSADFRPAYDPLLRMAEALGASDPAAAAALLRELQRLQPARPEAGQALLTLSRR